MESKDRKERERKGLESLHNDFWDVVFYLPYLYYFIYGLLSFVVQTISKTDKQTYRIQLQPCSDLTIDFQPFNEETK